MPAKNRNIAGIILQAFDPSQNPIQ